MSDPNFSPEELWHMRREAAEEARKKEKEAVERAEKEEKRRKGNLVMQQGFNDDPNQTPSERIDAFRKYLVLTDWESRGMGSIDQRVVDWAMEHGLGDAAMGGRRSRKRVNRSRRIKWR